MSTPSVRLGLGHLHRLCENHFWVWRGLRCHSARGRDRNKTVADPKPTRAWGVDSVDDDSNERRVGDDAGMRLLLSTDRHHRVVSVIRSTRSAVRVEKRNDHREPHPSDGTASWSKRQWSRISLSARRT